MMGVFWDYDGQHSASWPYAEMKIKEVSAQRNLDQMWSIDAIAKSQFPYVELSSDLG